MNAGTTPDSQGAMPWDNSWLHTRSTVTMLQLAICQIETSISDSNDSVQQLTDTFTQLAEQSLHDQDADQAHKTVAALQEVHSGIKKAITAFQFYDRINQRLQHVSNGLDRISVILKDLDTLNDPNVWQQMQTEVEAGYSMECEREIFHKIMNGETVEKVMAAYRAEAQEKHDHPPEDDIELF